MLVCFSGVGGVGKTVTVGAFLERNPEWIFVPSIVREYYKTKGITSEAEYLRDMQPSERYGFQVGLLHYYMESLRGAIAANSDTRTAERHLILDRSAFDHIAYAIYANPGATRDQVELAVAFGKDFCKLKPMVFLFPFPVSWSENVADGFRATDFGKNYVIDCLMRRVLSDARLAEEYRLFKIPEGTPLERAVRIENLLHAWGKKWPKL